MAASMTGTSTSESLWLSHTAITHPAANMRTPTTSHNHLCSENTSLTLIVRTSRPLHSLIAGLPRCGREDDAAEVYP